MVAYVQTVQLGAATVTLINVGYFRNTVTEAHASEGDSAHTEHSQALLGLPVQCMLIQLPTTNVLVDASLYDLAPDSPFFIPGYQPPPGILARLAEINVKPEQIAHVVITHAHFDHFNGITAEQDGTYRPCFPNARHYLGRADWENPDMQQALQESDSLASHTLAVLERQGLLELVTGNLQLTNALQIIASPGESPGHQIVRLSSEEIVLYCLGDLYHDTAEVEHPEQMAWWADSDAIQASRRALVETALAENAWLTAAHIPTFGRLEQTPSGVTWVPV